MDGETIVASAGLVKTVLAAQGAIGIGVAFSWGSLYQRFRTLEKIVTNGLTSAVAENTSHLKVVDERCLNHNRRAGD